MIISYELRTATYFIFVNNLKKKEEDTIYRKDVSRLEKSKSEEDCLDWIYTRNVTEF